MFVCGMYIWVHVTFVCVGVHTIYRCDMYSTSRHNTCVSGSSVSGGRFSAVIVRGLFYHCDREYMLQGGERGVLVQQWWGLLAYIFMYSLCIVGGCVIYRGVVGGLSVYIMYWWSCAIYR